MAALAASDTAASVPCKKSAVARSGVMLMAIGHAVALGVCAVLPERMAGCLQQW